MAAAIGSSSPIRYRIHPMSAMQPTHSYRGTPAAPGMAAGPALVWKKQQIEIPRTDHADPGRERVRLEQAVGAARLHIAAIRTSLEAEGHAEEAAVFEAHGMLLDDKSLHRKVNEALAQGWNAEAAWHDGVEAFARKLESLPDPTLALR